MDRFRSYQLRAIDFSSALEACSYGLEDALRSTIDYVLWLHKNEKQIFPNAILIRALQEQCQPKAWRDDYLELPMLGYDARNQLIRSCRIFERAAIASLDYFSGCKLSRI